MQNKKLFVFEGEKTEITIAENLIKNFEKEITGSFFSSEDIMCAYCTSIYPLHKEIENDKYLDMFGLLKEIEFNKKRLQNFTSDDFSEIYLFFDYDGHATNASDSKLSKIIAFFNEETNYGKVFISYPMVEALKHFSSCIDFKNLKVPAKENKKYKEIVSKEADKKYINFELYTKEIWVELIEIHLKKLNFIVNDCYSMPENNLISQCEIFSKQLKKYIEINSTVSVLSSFPVFLFDYNSKIIADLILKNKR